MRLSKEKRKLARRISVSKIAEQLWCEKKLELKLMHGIAVKTEAMAEGTRRHEKLSGRDTLPKPESFRDWLGFQLYLSALSLSNFPAKKAREVFIVSSFSHESWRKRWYLTGSVDELRLEDGKVRVVERKTTRSNQIAVIPSHKLQAMLYRKMLELAKEQNLCKNVRAAYGLSIGEKISSSFAEKAGIGKRDITELCMELSEGFRTLPPVDSRVCIVYERQRGGKLGEIEFEADELWLSSVLNFLREYWTGEREAERTKDGWKCRVCEIRDLCL